MTEFNRQLSEVGEAVSGKDRGEVTPEMVTAMRLKEMALNQLVDEDLLLQAGRRLGLEVSDDELRHHIQGYPAFQKTASSTKSCMTGCCPGAASAPSFEAQERGNCS